jgi:hypothetical protein
MDQTGLFYISEISIFRKLLYAKQSVDSVLTYRMYSE